MTEREIADHLFDVARSRARGAGRYFGDGTGHDLLDLTNNAARELAGATDPQQQLSHLRQAERDLRRLIDMAIDEAADVPDYPADLLGEQTYFPARRRFCPCRPFADVNLDGPKAEAENAKQVIALCTGALAFTVTFLEKFRPVVKGIPAPLPDSLYAAWVLFGLTIAFALWYLMALTGNISAVGRKENGWTLSSAEQLSADGDEGNTRLPGLLMAASFFLSVIALITLGFSLA